jgi:tRNA threonylcarbamoyladenosine biosynthesis protein TsaB
LEIASVGIARDGALLAQRENERPHDQAGWLHPAIESMMQETGLQMKELQAVAVTSGPGSYTGLRVGMAAAKGICYAQQIPLISVSTLQLLAAGVQAAAKDIIIALIDARRDEVYAGVFDNALTPLQPEQALILDPTALMPWRAQPHVVYTGNGAKKTGELLGIKDFTLLVSKNGALNFAQIASKKYENKDFADLVYHEPVYLKEFHHTAKDK